MIEKSTTAQDNMLFKQSDIFISGEDGYHTYRIPALLISKNGTILAFCEGRKYGTSDSGKIDLVLKRSFDYGKTWRDMQIIVAEEDMTCGNPCPVVDQSSGTIWLPFCKNPDDRQHGLLTRGQVMFMSALIAGEEEQRTVWITKSTDDGATWAEPIEITKDVKDSSWTWYATGPGHGIQLRNRRLVVPCNHAVGKKFNFQDPHHSHIIYSDDYGASWKIGGIVKTEGLDESAVVQTIDGALYINCRQEQGARRAYAWSQDDGDTFSKEGFDNTLVEPVCQASLVRFTDKEHHDKNRILFSNPASTKREKMTVRVSYDECQTWTVSKLLNKGPSAYSDLAIAPDMTICCLYERGEKYRYEKVTFAQFNIEWLSNGADYLLVE